MASTATVCVANMVPSLTLRSPASNSNAGVWTIAPGQCGSALVFDYSEEFAFLGATRRDYFLHRVDATGDVIVDKKAKGGGGLGTQTNMGTFTTPLVPGATYYVQRDGEKSRAITVQCSGGGTVVTSTPAATTAIKDCPVLYPNNLGAYNGKPVCMAKFPTKIKLSKCAGNGGQSWAMAIGLDYCIFPHDESWHARPTK